MAGIFFLVGDLLFGNDHHSMYSYVDSLWSGCCSVLEKTMGRRGSMRYSYVCVIVLVHLFRVTSLRIVFCLLFLRRMYLQGCCLWCLWYSALFVQCPGEFSFI